MISNQQKYNFQAANVTAKFDNTWEKLKEVLVQGNQEEFNPIRERLEQELTAYQQEGFISVALVGQYSAGKSTIISALTGKRDIKIDANIATDQTTSYNWNGIKIVDTPGLFTEKKDHDAITYDAISKADLLVFCLTSMLFDTITAENFKKLAYEKSYRWKMMLVVNKMSDEAGEDEQKIINYRQSLAEAIKPYQLDEFPICFIDAKDYCEGIDENDDFLTEISRFETFTNALNQFVAKRRSLARLDTPVRIVLESLDDAEIAFRRDQSEDTAFFEVLKRLSRTINLERSRLRTEIRNIALDLESEITNEGAMLASALGGDFDINSLKQKAENNVSNYYEKTLNNIEMVVKEATNSLQTEIETILTGDLVQAFLQRSQIQYQMYQEKNDSGIDIKQIQDQVDFLLDIGEKFGFNPLELATRDKFNTYQGRFFESNRCLWK
jgi:small GTP-binding protein